MEYEVMEHEVTEGVSVGEMRGIKNGFKHSLATEEPEEQSNGPRHTESCPDGCCTFVARYFLKAA